MSSQYPVLDNKPIDQWKVTELREELRRRKLVAKGLKEELVKRLDEALQEEMNSDNGVKQGHTVDPNAISQNNSDEDDVQLESEDNTQPLSTENNKTDKNLAVVDNNDNILNVNHGSEDHFMYVDELSGLARIDEKTAITEDFKVDAPGNRNVITKSETQVEDAKQDAKHGANYGDTNSADVQSECSNQVSEVSQDLGLQVKYTSISTDSVSINEKNIVKDNMNADNFLLELEDRKQVVLPSFNSFPSGGRDSCMVGEEQETGANCVTNEKVMPENCVIEEQVTTKDFTTDDQEVAKNLTSDVHDLSHNFSLDNKESTNSNAFNKQAVTQNHVSVQQPVTEVHTEKAPIEDPTKKEYNIGAGSPEKLNLDRSSGDESMEEDLLEGKHIEVDFKFEEPTINTEDKMLDAVLAQKTPTLDAVDKFSQENIDISVEDVKPTAPIEKRKHEETETVGNNSAPKRQRRWNTDTIKPTEQPMPHLNIPMTLKDNVQPALHRTFSRSTSTLCVDSPKERIVPSPKKPVTTSLRIDNFLRPFTLKAVQELLAKTGKVCDFWMDHIKTHCYVTYSSVEEATETRNAVYNLQWPSNGGRNLAAEFVDPQEVKARSEAPPPSPSTPITPSPATAPQVLFPQQIQAHQPQGSQNLRQQPLPPPPPLVQLPSLPLLSNPPIARERLPPPPPKKPEPPVLTLDDLFKKTKATPWIYYLPLSEEQVAAKLAAQGKNTQQMK